MEIVKLRIFVCLCVHVNVHVEVRGITLGILSTIYLVCREMVSYWV